MVHNFQIIGGVTKYSGKIETLPQTRLNHFLEKLCNLVKLN